MPQEMPEEFTVQLSFSRHYFEPDMVLKIKTEELLEHKSIEYMMVFDAAKTGKWELVLMHDMNKEMIGLAEFD